MAFSSTPKRHKERTGHKQDLAGSGDSPNKDVLDANVFNGDCNVGFPNSSRHERNDISPATITSNDSSAESSPVSLTASDIQVSPYGERRTPTAKEQFIRNKSKRRTEQPKQSTQGFWEPAIDCNCKRCTGEVSDTDEENPSPERQPRLIRVKVDVHRSYDGDVFVRKPVDTDNYLVKSGRKASRVKKGTYGAKKLVCDDTIEVIERDIPILSEAQKTTVDYVDYKPRHSKSKWKKCKKLFSYCCWRCSNPGVIVV